MNSRRSPRASPGGSRLLVLWLGTVAVTLVATHIPIHLRLAGRGEDFAFFLWMSSAFGCLLILFTTWLGGRLKSERFTGSAISFTCINRDLIITSVLHAGQLCCVVHFLTYDGSSAGGFPVANALAFGLVPLLVCWTQSLARESPFLFSSALHQITMVLLSCGLLYAATGLMHDGLYITDVIMAIVSASLAAASKVSLSLAYEHNSAPNVIFFRLLVLVVVFPVYILLLGHSGAAMYWLRNFRSVVGYMFVMAIALPVSDYLVLLLQIAASTPFSSVVTDAVAWLPSSLFAAFISKVDLFNSSLAGFLFLPVVLALHLLALHRHPHTHSGSLS